MPEKNASVAARRALDVSTLALQGSHLIEASAGTGKTYTITSLVLRLLAEEGRPLESILAVTFTNAATSELKERINRRIDQARRVVALKETAEGDPVLEHLLRLPHQNRVKRRLEMAARDADRASVFTIHGFAARMLKEHALQSGVREDAELSANQGALVIDVVTDFWSTRIATLPRETFEQLGGSSFYALLTKVARVAAGAPYVPLVKREEPTSLCDSNQNYRLLFAQARQEFERRGDDLLQMLVTSSALSRNKMRVTSLEADFINFREFFAAEPLDLPYPKTDRFTQSKVDSSCKKNSAPPQDELLVLLEQLQESAESVDLAVAHFADGLREELCKTIIARVKKEHERQGTQSFDGLLVDLCEALRREGSGESLANEIRKQLPVALIDEFQDTDPVQYEIFDRIYGAHSNGSLESGACSQNALYLIGDPKQSIYAFRGADLHTYLKVASQRTEGVWTLSTSYRASPRLVAAQNILFQSTSNPFASPAIVYDVISARAGAQDLLLDSEGQALAGMSICDCQKASAEKWLKHTADEIARFLQRGHTLGGRAVTPGDIAVLTRTNRHAEELQSLLRDLGIPAVLQGDKSVLESEEALEIRRILRALVEPADRSLCRTALATRLVGVTAEELEDNESNAPQLEKWVEQLRGWAHLLSERGVTHAFSALLAEIDVEARTLSVRGGERRMTNIRHLMELLHEAEITEHLGGQGLLRWFDLALSDKEGQFVGGEARQLRLESDVDAITLTTAHKSKGLEYNIVFLPTVGQADPIKSEEAFRFFDPEQDKTFFESRGKTTQGFSAELHQVEVQQESLRLAYVALTRAKHHTVVFVGSVNKFSALSYFFHEANARTPGGLAPLTERLSQLADEVRLEEIKQICDQSSGALEFEVLSNEPGPQFRKKTLEIDLCPPESLPALMERERTSSFSAMTRDSHRVLSRAAREGRDIDEIDRGEVEESLLLADESRQSAVDAPVRSVLAEFPRGARPGDALHAIFEFSAFFDGSVASRGAVVERELSKRGFVEADIRSAAQSLEDVLQVPLDREAGGAEGALSLGQLSASQCAAEMEFSFPVAEPHERLSAARLAAALQRGLDAEGGAGLLSDFYVESIRELSFVAWSGFLRGFIDLVFEHEGKLYGVDYKSNYLGENYEDYGQEATTAAMQEHHYLLQALLYAVAIHRYGKLRISDYSYEKNFGGMRYLFLRGMHPLHGMNGVHYFRPNEAMLNALSEVLDGVSKAGAER